MPYFSVIIPLYNKESFIEKTLECVLNQTFKDFEIIIVNDGSTDASLEKIKKFTDNRIKIFQQENQGVSVARNKGMEMAEGEYFCFLDADDEWKNDYLENLFFTIKKFPDAGMYCSRYKTKIADGKYTFCKFIDISEEYEGYIKDFFWSSFQNRIALTSAVCIYKNVFKKIGGFDKKISSGQDLDYWIRISLKHNVVICKNTTVIYNFLQTNKSLSRSDINKKTLPSFDQFLGDEKKNPSLKKFLDLYRIEYALHFHTFGNKEKKKFYLKEVEKENIDPKVKLLLFMPAFILRYALYGKRYLKQFGIDFNIYH